MMVARLLIFGTACVFATAAQAQCRLDSFVVSNGQIVARYDPFEASSAPTSISLQSSGSEDCENKNVRITLDADPSTPLAVNGASIRLQSDNATLEGFIVDRNGRAPNGLGSGGAQLAILKMGAQGDIRDGELQLVLESGQRVPPGMYRARLELSAEPLQANGRDDNVLTSPFDVLVLVEPVVGLAAGSSTALDLGTIRSGGTAPSGVSFRAYANTGYELHFRSDHDFALTLNGDAGAPAIGYLPTLEGQPFTPGPAGVDFGNPGQSGFRQHMLNVQVPTLERRPAGTYRDYITVEIRATVSG